MPFQTPKATVLLCSYATVVALLAGGCGLVEMFRPDKPSAFMDKPIVIGHGLGELEVGKTTMGEAVSLLGDKFQRDEIQGSFGGKCTDGVCDNNREKFTDVRLDYTKYGLMLGFRSIEGHSAPETDLKLRFIYITCAQRGSACTFTGKTDSGIHLGSTRRDVEAALGKSDTWTGQQGIVCKQAGVNIRFRSDPGKLSDDDPVESFELFSPDNFSEFEHRSI